MDTKKRNIITDDITLIKGAMGLLNMSQRELSSLVGITEQNLSRGLKRQSALKKENIDIIKTALEKEGVEFKADGVSLSTNIVHVITGEDCYLKLLDDAFITLKDSGGEYLKSSADESRTNKAVLAKLQSMKNVGIAMRALIKNGDTYIHGPLEEYRWMDEKIFSSGDVKIIYGDKVAYLASWINKVIIIQDKRIADEARKIFDFIWEISVKPTHTTISKDNMND